MQIKDGKLKLSKRDYRVGNFVVSDEDSHIKVQDISRMVSFRVSKMIPKGQLLLSMVKDRQDTALQNYIAVAYNFLGTIPDLEMLQRVNEECVACLERHKEFYGVSDNVSEEEDREMLEDAKEMVQAGEDFARVKSGIEDGTIAVESVEDVDGDAEDNVVQ